MLLMCWPVDGKVARVVVHADLFGGLGAFIFVVVVVNLLCHGHDILTDVMSAAVLQTFAGQGRSICIFTTEVVGRTPSGGYGISSVGGILPPSTLQRQLWNKACCERCKGSFNTNSIE